MLLLLKYVDQSSEQRFNFYATGSANVGDDVDVLF